MAKTPNEIAQEILAVMDEKVRDLSHADYREVLGELISSLQLREGAAEEEASEHE